MIENIGKYWKTFENVIETIEKCIETDKKRIEIFESWVETFEKNGKFWTPKIACSVQRTAYRKERKIGCRLPKLIPD